VNDAFCACLTSTSVLHSNLPLVWIKELSVFSIIEISKAIEAHEGERQHTRAGAAAAQHKHARAAANAAERKAVACRCTSRLLLVLLLQMLVAALTLLAQALLKELFVIFSLLLALANLLALLSTEAALALQPVRGNEALDVGHFGLGLAMFILVLAGIGEGVLADIVALAEVEEAADLAGALWPAQAGLLGVSKALDVLLADFGDDAIDDGVGVGDDAPADGLAAAGAVAEGVAAHALFAGTEKEAHALLLEHAELHREALLVLPTSDLQHIALELLAESVTLNLLAQALLIERLQLLLVEHLQLLLRARRWVRQVDLRERRDFQEKRRFINRKTNSFALWLCSSGEAAAGPRRQGGHMLICLQKKEKTCTPSLPLQLNRRLPQCPP